MSDHLPVFATRIYKRNKGPNNNSHHVINFRNMKQLDTGKLISALKNAPWDCVFLLEDIDEVLDTWYDIFNSVIDELLPLQQKRVKREVQPKWFTNNISQKIKSRDKALKRARKSNLETDWNIYKKAKNNVTSLIRNAKQNYFKDKFSEHKNNSSKL
jgi:uncharacterized membrane protein